jgi:hypothetical protein
MHTQRQKVLHCGQSLSLFCPQRDLFSALFLPHELDSAGLVRGLSFIFEPAGGHSSGGQMQSTLSFWMELNW